MGVFLSKTAQTYNLKMNGDLAYGVVKGYMVSFSEDSFNINMGFGAFFDDASNLSSFINEVHTVKAKNRISGFSQYDKGFIFKFANNWFGKKNIYAFMDWVLDRLYENGAKGYEYCAICRQQDLSNVAPVAIEGHAFCAHEACIEPMIEAESISISEKQTREKKVLPGTIGAVLGGLVAAIPWIIADYYGWFVGWFGYLIGWGAKRGYEMLGGKPGKAKQWIVIGVVAICVLLSTFASWTAAVYFSFANEGITMSFSLLMEYVVRIMTDSEYIGGILLNVFLGYVFAFLGCMRMFKELGQETHSMDGKIKKLDR